MTTNDNSLNQLTKHLKAARDELDILSGDITLNGETTADSLAEHLDAAIREGKQQAAELKQLRAQVRELLEERDCYWGGQTRSQQQTTTNYLPCGSRVEYEGKHGRVGTVMNYEWNDSCTAVIGYYVARSGDEGYPDCWECKGLSTVAVVGGEG